jgi:hypothetical protein
MRRAADSLHHFDIRTVLLECDAPLIHSTSVASINKRAYIMCIFLCQVVELDFNYFQTEECCDFVSVLDGYDEKSPLIEMFSGSYFLPPGGITSTQRYLFVRFMTDETVMLEGFSATYVSGRFKVDQQYSKLWKFSYTFYWGGGVENLMLPYFYFLFIMNSC